jgi:hypothetical protein
MAQEEWRVILANQLEVGVDEENRVILSLDCGRLPVEAETAGFRVGMALFPDAARALAAKLLRAADEAEAGIPRH